MKIPVRRQPEFIELTDKELKALIKLFTYEESAVLKKLAEKQIKQLESSLVDHLMTDETQSVVTFNRAQGKRQSMLLLLGLSKFADLELQYRKRLKESTASK